MHRNFWSHCHIPLILAKLFLRIIIIVVDYVQFDIVFYAFSSFLSNAHIALRVLLVASVHKDGQLLLNWTLEIGRAILEHLGKVIVRLLNLIHCAEQASRFQLRHHLTVDVEPVLSIQLQLRKSWHRSIRSLIKLLRADRDGLRTHWLLRVQILLAAAMVSRLEVPMAQRLVAEAKHI